MQKKSCHGHLTRFMITSDCTMIISVTSIYVILLLWRGNSNLIYIITVLQIVAKYARYRSLN